MQEAEKERRAVEVKVVTACSGLGPLCEWPNGSEWPNSP